jgi:hypothetical protein
MTHGWAPGLRDAVSSAGGFLLVWDDDAITEQDKRFDGRFAPLAEAIATDDPDSAVPFS